TWARGPCVSIRTPTRIITWCAISAGKSATCMRSSPGSSSREGGTRGSRSRTWKWSSAGCATSVNHAREIRGRLGMAELKGTKTEENLKEAFAGESQANRRYLYFAQKADVEGYPDVAALFRSVAEGETGHAFGHFDYLAEVGDPVTGVPVGPTEDNLKSAI